MRTNRPKHTGQQPQQLRCASRIGLPAISLALAALLQFAPAQARTPESYNRTLASGINLGNALEAPNEGDWGVTLQPEYFQLIRAMGLSHVRVPISWSTHAGHEPPYAIEPAFMARIDWVISHARANGLAVIINMHHYDEMEADAAGHHDRFIAMWKQIAEHMRSQPDDVAFEIYNEPCRTMTAEYWNRLFAETLNVVRVSNPDRCVVVGPINWNNPEYLSGLRLPRDNHLIATFHYYDPQQFTHQGAEWMGPESQKWLGTRWAGTAQEVAQIRSDFDAAAAWGRQHNVPMYLGEYGAYEKADMDSRVRWTRTVRAEAKNHGFSDAYWEFCSGFGVYDAQKREWRRPLLDVVRTR